MDTLALFCGLGIGLVLLAATRLFLAPVVYPLFRLSENAAGIATMMLTFTAAAMPLRAFNTTNTVGVLRGGGDVRAAMLIDIPPVVRLPPPGRPVRPGVPVGHLLGLCGGLYGAGGQAGRGGPPLPFPGMDRRRHNGGAK